MLMNKLATGRNGSNGTCEERENEGERECVKKKEALKVTLKAQTHTFIHGNAAEH